jgi:hypothetical protein
LSSRRKFHLTKHARRRLATQQSTRNCATDEDGERIDQDTSESPGGVGNGTSRRQPSCKPIWPYAVAFVAGGLAGVIFLMPPLPGVDDRGNLQFLLGACLGLITYAILF